MGPALHVGFFPKKGPMVIDILLVNNENSSKYIVIQDKHVPQVQCRPISH